MKCTNTYKKFTIKSLLNSLEEIMARNPEITLDSEVIISDINMSSFKHRHSKYFWKEFWTLAEKEGAKTIVGLDAHSTEEM